MTHIDALKLALETYIKAGIGNSTNFALQGTAYDLAIEALSSKATGTQPPINEQEPAAEYIGESWEGSLVQLYDDVKKGTKLYTSPPQRRPLTDEELDAMSSEFEEGYIFLYRSFARAIEAKLKE